MTITLRTRTQFSSKVVVLVLLLTNAAFGWSDDLDPLSTDVSTTDVSTPDLSPPDLSTPDPTTPSPTIVERLAAADAVPQTDNDGITEGYQAHHFRLKALVLRDNNNGTAIVSLGASENYLVRLRRSTLHSTTNRTSFRGMNFCVKDFSESSVIIHIIETNQQFTITGL